MIELTESHDQTDVLQTYARWSGMIFSCHRTGIGLLDGTGGLHLNAVEAGVVTEDGDWRSLDYTVLGEVSLTQKTIVDRDVNAQSRFPDLALMSKRGVRAIAAVPLRFGDTCLGAMGIAFRAPEELEDSYILLLETVARCLASYLLLHQQIERLNNLSITDPLTGCYNRRHFHSVVDASFEKWRSDGTPLSIAFLDLDHFKSVNDTFGHDFGDEVLRETARVLRDVATKEEIAVRLGGEEFCLVMPGVPLSAALDRAETLRQRISTLGLTFEGEPVSVTSSFGVASLGRDVSDIESLMTVADTALYSAKSAGRNRVMPAQPPAAAASA